MRIKISLILYASLFMFSTNCFSQYCTNFKASYDGVRLKLSGLNNSGKVKVSVTHNGGITYTDITALLPAGQDNAVLILKEPVESVLMEGSDIAGSTGSKCQKIIPVVPTITKSSTPILSIIAPRGVNTIKTDKGTLSLSVSVLPTSISNKSVTWSVVNGSGKASINSSGVVTAECNGTVTVTATSVQVPSVSKSISVVISGQTATCPNSVDDVSTSISVYPNPAKDVVTITSDLKIKKIDLFDLSGILVKQVVYDAESSINLDVNSLPKGMYILKFETSEGVGVHKVVKD